MSWEWPDSIVTNVVDGDTIDARVRRDMGFGGVAEFIVRLRLNRINAAKVSSERGKAARDYVVELTRGLPVLIETLKPYKYGGPDSSPGEWMAEVIFPDGRNLSDELELYGLAAYWDGQGPRPNDDDPA